MRKLWILLLITLIGGCHSWQSVQIGTGLERFTGFKELPFPSNAYAPSQIVEIYTKPEKVEITYQPDIPWDMHHVSPGWDIDSRQMNKAKTNIALEISKILKGQHVYISEDNIHVQFTDTKTRLLPKSLIYSTLKKDIESDSILKKQLEDYMEFGTRFDVITMTLSGVVTISITDQNNNELVVDSEVINKLNSEIKLNFEFENSTKRLISGEELVIGIHYDTRMIGLIFNKHKN